MTITFVFRLWQFISGSQRFVGTCTWNAWNLSRGVVLATEYRKLEKKKLTYEAGLRESLEVPDFLMRQFVWADVLSFSFRHSASRRCGMKEKCQKNRARRVNCIRDRRKFVCDLFSFPSAFFLSRNWRAFAAGNFNLHCHSTRKLSWNRR